jgi:hypothetical protein
MARPLGIRQQALATAQVYVRRFYLKVEIRRTNPALVLATALYLACKMEECPQHIRMVLGEARQCWGMFSLRSNTQLLTFHNRYLLQRHLQNWRVRVYIDLRDEFTTDHPPSIPQSR